MEEPICFIKNSTSGLLEVNQKALQILSKVQQPVIVVAIVGLYRTGKSYLMNKLAGKQKGFSLGSTVQSHTKGIWIWCLPHPTKTDCTLVLLDTEGLGDVMKVDEKSDNWIFALAVLLSSTFIYNSMGTIDQYALEKLHFVTQLTKFIKVKSSHDVVGDSCHFVRVFPAFIWVVRDFTLELEVDECPITEDEYLENALKLQFGDSERIRKYNFARECIRKYFPSRNCFVFERPVVKLEKLRIIEELTETELEPSFLEKAQKFCQHISETAKTKTVQGGHSVTGTMLGKLAETYVEAINNNAIPCMENAVVALTRTENSAAVKKAHEYYVKEMKTRVPTLTVKELSDLHTLCEKEAIQIFMKLSFKDYDLEYQKQLMSDLHLSYEEFHRLNEKESVRVCTEVIRHVSRTLEDRITEGYYCKPGGYSCFQEDKDRVITDYKAFLGERIKMEEVLNNFLKDKEAVMKTILQSDETLTKKNEEIEAERMKKEATERDMIVMKKNEEALQQNILDQKKSNKENIQQLKIKWEEDRRKLQEEQERALENKLKEQKYLLDNKFSEKYRSMTAEIKSLQKEIEDTKFSWSKLFSWLLGPMELIGEAFKESASAGVWM